MPQREALRRGKEAKSHLRRSSLAVTDPICAIRGQSFFVLSESEGAGTQRRIRFLPISNAGNRSPDLQLLNSLNAWSAL